MSKRLEIVDLTEEEKKELLSIIKEQKNNRLKNRAKIILYSYEKIPVINIQKELNISRQTISTWKKRFLKYRIKGLLDLRIRKHIDE